MKPCRVDEETQWRWIGRERGRASWAEQYVLTMATGILLYFHLLIEIAGTEKEKKQAQVETNVYVDQITGNRVKKKKRKVEKLNGWNHS